MAEKSFIQNIGEQAAGGLAGGLVGAGMGLLLEKHNDRRQIKQQQKLTDMQLNANKGMADYNRQMQMQMWRDTNYSAQMGELEKAGLNPGLIYGMSGGGATTTGNGGGSGVSGAMAPSGGGEAMGLMMQKMQIGLMEAQRQNIEANTGKTKAETGNVPLTGENIKASTASITQGINNQKAVEDLTKVQTRIANIEANIKDLSQERAIDYLMWEAIEMEQQAKKTLRENKIGETTQEDVIAKVHAELIGIGVQNALMRAQKGLADAKTVETGSNIRVNEQQILNMKAKIVQDYLSIEYTGRSAGENERSGGHQRFINDVSRSTGLAMETVQDILQAVILRGAMGGNRTTTEEKYDANGNRAGHKITHYR